MSNSNSKETFKRAELIVAKLTRSLIVEERWCTCISLRKLVIKNTFLDTHSTAEKVRPGTKIHFRYIPPPLKMIETRNYLNLDFQEFRNPLTYRCLPTVRDNLADNATNFIFPINPLPLTTDPYKKCKIRSLQSGQKHRTDHVFRNQGVLKQK